MLVVAVEREGRDEVGEGSEINFEKKTLATTRTSAGY